MKAPTASRRSLLSGGALPSELGRYLVVRELAAGGFGTVYLARPRDAIGAARWIALKVMHRHLARDPDFVAMFFDEVRIATAVSHPNVCQVLEAGTDGGQHYLAMELVLGEPVSVLAKRLRAEPRLLSAQDRIGLALRIGIDIASGLHAAHEAVGPDGAPLAIVHRDVAPQNVYVRHDGHAQLLDFGVAKAMGRTTHSVSGQIKGHIPYMSPEQVTSEGVDRRNDVFSLSVLLWELLANATLFHRASDAATLFAIASEGAPRLDAKERAVPRAIADVIARGLARDPGARFRTAEELVEALERAGADVLAKVPRSRVQMLLDILVPGGRAAKRTLLEDAQRAIDAMSEPARRAGPDEDLDTVPFELDPSPDVDVSRVQSTSGEGARLEVGQSRAVPLAIAAALTSVLAAAIAFTITRSSAPSTLPTPSVAPDAHEPESRASLRAPDPVDDGASGVSARELRAAEPDVPPPEPSPGDSTDAQSGAEPSTPPPEDAPRDATSGAEDAPARARRAEPRAGPPGFIDVATRGGWAQVYDGSRLLGESPGHFEARPGVHRLRVVSGDGRVTRVVRVVVHPGRRSAVTVDLRP